MRVWRSMVIDILRCQVLHTGWWKTEVRSNSDKGQNQKRYIYSLFFLIFHEKYQQINNFPGK